MPSDPAEAALLGQLSSDPLHVDELVRATDLPIHLVSSTLTMMELKGMISNVGGQQYVLAR